MNNVRNFIRNNIQGRIIGKRRNLLFLTLILANGLCIYNLITSRTILEEDDVIQPHADQITELHEKALYQHKRTTNHAQLALYGDYGIFDNEETYKTAERDEKLKSEKHLESSYAKKSPFKPTKPTGNGDMSTNIKSCPIKWEETWFDRNIETNKNPPMINLDPDKFLLPIPVNGPNNQLIGVRESIYVAIRLNRTLVIPQFFKHRTDEKYENGTTIHPGHRMDLDYLRQLIPCVTLDYFRDVCSNRVQAVFRVRKMTLARYRSIEENLQMRFLSRVTGTDKIIKADPFADIMQYPLNAQLQKKIKFFDIQPDEAAIRKLYPGKEKCVIFPSAFKNLKIDEVRPEEKRDPKSIDLQRISDEELYTNIIRFTRLPKHILQLAKEFVSKVMKDRPFLSIHWRFDRTDWMRRCLAPEPWGTENRQKMCQTILSFSPMDVAQVVAERIYNISGDVKVNDVYIAFPTTESDLMVDVVKLLRRDFNYNVYTHLEVTNFWKKSFSSCDWLWQHRDDILSSTEMEICVLGVNFLRSAQSTWSKNVYLRRRYDVFSNSTDFKKGISEFVKYAKEAREHSKKAIKT